MQQKCNINPHVACHAGRAAQEKTLELALPRLHRAVRVARHAGCDGLRNKGATF